MSRQQLVRGLNFLSCHGLYLRVSLTTSILAISTRLAGPAYGPSMQHQQSPYGYWSWLWLHVISSSDRTTFYVSFLCLYIELRMHIWIKINIVASPILLGLSHVYPSCSHLLNWYVHVFLPHLYAQLTLPVEIPVALWLQFCEQV